MEIIFIPTAAGRLRSLLLALAVLQAMATTPSEKTGTAARHDDDDFPAVSPAMAAFFHGHRGTATPAAGDNSTTVPNWRRPAPELKQKDNGVRTLVLVAAVVCGAVGVGLLLTAAMSYATRQRRRKPSPEIQLGAAA